MDNRTIDQIRENETRLIKILDYQAEEIDQYKNNWEELKKWLKENSWYYNTSDGCQWVDQFKILNKMKELEGSDANGSNK